MKLYYKGTDREVQKGDVLTDFRGDKAIAEYWKEPNHGVGKYVLKIIQMINLVANIMCQYST